MSDLMPSLSDDLVPDLAGIARYMFDSDDPKMVRRVRHLIDRHDLPVVERGRFHWSFKTWLDRYARGETVEVGSGR